MKTFLLVTLLLVTGGACFADTIQLIDGRTLKGQIVQEEADRIVFKDESGRMNNFYRDQVVNLIRGDSMPLNVDAAQFGDIPADKAGYIVRLMAVNGTKSSLERNIRRNIDAAPASRRDELEKLFDLNEIIAALVPIYDKYYSQEEIIALIAFYESPAGQKMIEVSPDLIMEVTEASLNYFQGKATKP